MLASCNTTSKREARHVFFFKFIIIILAVPRSDSPAVYPVFRLVDHGDSVSWDYRAHRLARANNVSLPSRSDLAFWLFPASCPLLPLLISKLKERSCSARLVTVGCSTVTTCGSWGARHPAPDWGESLVCSRVILRSPGFGWYVASWGHPWPPHWSLTTHPALWYTS